MMAFIGFVLVLGLGVFLLGGGLLVLYGASQFGSLKGSDLLSCLLLIVFGGWLIYWACMHAPFAIVVRGAA